MGMRDTHEIDPWQRQPPYAMRRCCTDEGGWGYQDDTKFIPGSTVNDFPINLVPVCVVNLSNS